MNREAFFKISYGLYIVSTADGEQKGGYVANTVFQVSSNPARIAISCSKDNFTNHLIKNSGVFAISVLREDYDKEIMNRFGYRSGKDTDKFEGIQTLKGKTAAPIVKDDCIAWFECEVERQMDLGTHTLFIGKLIDSDLLDADATPLTYDYFHKVKRGMAPKNAPTYQERTTETESSEEKPGVGADTYVCDVCGYEYDPAVGDPENGIPPGTPFEDLPDDWTCPTCGADKEFFSKQ